MYQLLVVFSTLEEAAAVEGMTLEDFMADLKREPQVALDPQTKESSCLFLCSGT